MVFSNTTTNVGILEQTLVKMRVDSTQWPKINVVNACNNRLDYIAGYAIGADTRFQWDDTNHTKLPEGTTPLVAGQKDYSFLTDQQGNTILTLTRMTLIRTSDNIEVPLNPIDRKNVGYNIKSFGVNTGTPTAYDKIADNICRLDFKPSATDVSTYTLKFYFQRTPSHFVEADTTKQPGVPPILHYGFVVSSAYEGAVALGLDNLQALSVELQKEDQKMIQAFSGARNVDESSRMTMKEILYI